MAEVTAAIPRVLTAHFALLRVLRCSQMAVVNAILGRISGVIKYLCVGNRHNAETLDFFRSIWHEFDIGNGRTNSLEFHLFYKFMVKQSFSIYLNAHQTYPFKWGLKISQNFYLYYFFAFLYGGIVSLSPTRISFS